MAIWLINGMATPWHSEAHADTFATATGEPVKQNTNAGEEPVGQAVGKSKGQDYAHAPSDAKIASKCPATKKRAA